MPCYSERGILRVGRVEHSRLLASRREMMLFVWLCRQLATKANPGCLRSHQRYEVAGLPRRPNAGMEMKEGR
jgi:hypothetical protein